VLGVTAAEFERANPPGTVSERVGHRAALRWVARLLEQDAEDESSFSPAQFEWAFGYESDPADFGSFALRGRIDRLDADGFGHVVVTDYKRSAVSTWNSDALLEKGKLQVLLYMGAAQRLLGLEPVAGVYRGLREDVTSGVVLEGSDAVTALSRKNAEVPAELLERLCSDAAAMAAEAVAGMRAGRIDPLPRTADACTHCPVRRVCREAR